MHEASKHEHLHFFTKNEDLIAELLSYTENAFCTGGENIGYRMFEDEPQISDWKDYVTEAEHSGVYEMLKKCWVPFQFPVKKNISQTTDYRNATLKGASTEFMQDATGLSLIEPEKLRLHIYPSLAGKIPVLIANNRSDFQSILRALSCRNEPAPLPDSMGAAMIKGINNWNRLLKLKRTWQFNAVQNSGYGNKLLNNKPLYQDSIILLSRIPYSNISGQEMNLRQDEWLDQSLKIRLEHECAHYFTLRYFGKMANNMHDELIADYMGICAVLPHYNAEWFLRFIGLEQYPVFRVSGRMKNYLGKPPISPAAFEVLQTIIFKAAKNIEQFDKEAGKPLNDIERQLRILCLCKAGVLKIAVPNGAKLLYNAYQDLQVEI